MGQESSQIAGQNQNADGVIIKPDPGDKENDSLQQVTDYESSVVRRESLGNELAKDVKGPKKKRKKQKSVLPPQPPQETATKPSKGKIVNSTVSSQQLSGIGKGSAVEASQSSGSANRKNAELEAKKRRLLAVATAAAGDVHSQYSDREGDAGAFDEMNDNATNESEFDHDSALKLSKLLKKSRSSATPTQIASGIQKVKKTKTRTKSSLTVTQQSVNDNVHKHHSNSQLPTPAASGQALHQDTGANYTFGKKRKSDFSERESTIKTKGMNQQQSTSRPDVDSSDEVMSNNLHFDNPYTPGRRLPSPQTLGIYPGSTPNQNRGDVYPANLLYDSEASTASSSLPYGQADNSISGTLQRKPIAGTKLGHSQQDATKETRIPPLKSKSAPVAVMMTPARTQSGNSQGMSLIDPSLRDLGAESSKHIQQIGIYKDIDTPQMSARRKRRLPVDETFSEEEFDERPARKQRKTPVKPKTPKKNGAKEKANVLRDRSPEPDQPSSGRRKGKSAEKSLKRPRTDGPKLAGRFTEEEIAIINNELLKHREMYEMSEFDQNQLIQDDAATATEFWDEVCSALPDRGRQAVIKICRRKYHNYGIRGIWTKEEDQELKEAYDKFPKSWKQIGQYLHRHPEDVRDRWRNYVICGEKKKTDHWTEEEENNLRSVVGECVQAVRELKAAEAARNPRAKPDERPDIELVDWLVVSEKLGFTRSRLQCLCKWKQMIKLEDPHDDEVEDLDLNHKSWRIAQAKKDVKNMRREEYLELLLAIRNSQAGREGKVPWQRLGDMDLKTKWSTMARKVAWKKLRATVSGNRDMKLQDIVTRLINNLPSESEVNAHFQPESVPKRGVEDTRPALRAAIQSLKRKQANNDGPKSEHGGLQERSTARVEDLDPPRIQLADDEFDPDDIVGTSAPRRSGPRNHHASQHMLPDTIDGEYDNNSTDEDSAGEDLIMENIHEETAESIDLDAPSQKMRRSSRAARLRSPVAFNGVQNSDALEDVESQADSDEDELDIEIPAGRSRAARRNESVDLDMY